MTIGWRHQFQTADVVACCQLYRSLNSEPVQAPAGAASHGARNVQGRGTPVHRPRDQPAWMQHKKKRRFPSTPKTERSQRDERSETQRLFERWLPFSQSNETGKRKPPWRLVHTQAVSLTGEMLLLGGPRGVDVLLHELTPLDGGHPGG